MKSVFAIYRQSTLWPKCSQGIFLAISFALIFLAGCKQRVEPNNQQQITYGLWSAPTTLDPRLVATPTDILVVSALFTGLVATNAKGEIIPGIAQSWNVSSDGLNYIFKLRPSKWSDNTPITAQDFVFSMRRLFGRQSTLNALDYAAIANGEAILAGRQRATTLGVRALTPDVLEISLDRPLPALLALLAQPAAAPVPAHAIRRYGNAWLKPEHFVGNGAFTLKKWIRPKDAPEQLVLIANPNFYEASSDILSVINLRIEQNPAQAVAAFQQGKLDLLEAAQLPPELLEPLDGNLLRQDMQWGMTYLLLNHARNPLQDLLIRRALLLAMSTNESVPQNLIPSSLPSYPNAVQPDWAEWDIAKRVQEVQRLLEQANYTQQNPLPLTLSITKSTQDGLLAERLKEQLKAYPITLNVETRTPKAHLQALRAGAFDIARRTWVPGIDMPENFLSLFKCDMPLLNFGRVCNKEADALVEEALQVPDPQQRAALLKQVERLYIEEGAAIALGVPVANTLVSLKVTGWVDNPSGQHALRWLRLADNTQKQ